MRFVRRSTQLFATLVVLAVGVLLILEITDVIGRRWRIDTADFVGRMLDPDYTDWVLALGGAALGLVAVGLIAAQIAPAPKGTSRMLEVDSADDGDTHLAGRAALRAVEHELRTIDGVTGATAVMPTMKRIHATVRVDDRCDISDVETQARAVLDTPFWINLGLPDIAIAITAEFDRRPPRVR